MRLHAYGLVLVSNLDLPRLPESGPGPAYFGRRPFRPLRADRVQRFTTGDWVRVVRGGLETGPVRILECAADPHPPAFAHCSGRSAKYRVETVGCWVYDWMLESAPVPSLWRRVRSRLSEVLGKTVSQRARRAV